MRVARCNLCELSGWLIAGWADVTRSDLACRIADGYCQAARNHTLLSRIKEDWARIITGVPHRGQAFTIAPLNAGKSALSVRGAMGTIQMDEASDQFGEIHTFQLLGHGTITADQDCYTFPWPAGIKHVDQFKITRPLDLEAFPAYFGQTTFGCFWLNDCPDLKSFPESCSEMKMSAQRSSAFRIGKCPLLTASDGFPTDLSASNMAMVSLLQLDGDY